MRILDTKNKKILNSVLIMLTEKEAKELSEKIKLINPLIGDHIHVDDFGYKREITVLIYNSENLKFFSKDVRKVIEEGNS